MTIVLDIISQIPRRKGSWQLEVPAGIAVQDMLVRLGFAPDEEEVLVVYNGKAVYPDDSLPDSGTVKLLPILCGG